MMCYALTRDPVRNASHQEFKIPYSLVFKTKCIFQTHVLTNFFSVCPASHFVRQVGHTKIIAIGVFQCICTTLVRSKLFKCSQFGTVGLKSITTYSTTVPTNFIATAYLLKLSQQKPLKLTEFQRMTVDS